MNGGPFVPPNLTDQVDRRYLVSSCPIGDLVLSLLRKGNVTGVGVAGHREALEIKLLVGLNPCIALYGDPHPKTLRLTQKNFDSVGTNSRGHG